MSQENLDAVREMNLAFNRHDDHWLDFYDADVEYVMPPEWPEDRVYRGHESLRGLTASLTAIFEGQTWTIERMIDAGEDCVVILAQLHASIHGDELGQKMGAVHYMRAGKIARQLTYFSWAEALDAAGISE